MPTSVAAIAAAPVPPRPAAAPSPLRPAAAADPSLAGLGALVETLRQKGFTLRLEPPPRRGAYGLFEPARRLLWVSPLAFELGIGRQTLLHEAVHAAQSCPDGQLSPIGWALTLSPVVDRQISYMLTTGYHHGSLALEREAFAMQGQPDAPAKVIAALRRRCPPAGSVRRPLPPRQP